MRDNAVVSCKEFGFYIEGHGVQSIILHNLFMVCRCAGITLNTLVDAFVALNEFQISSRGIDIFNNKSILFGNRIQKSHEHGISVVCNSPVELYKATPLIQKNYIESCTKNGIICEGFSCYPIIKANIIDSNRKCGIKLSDSARAHIGGDDTIGQLAQRVDESLAKNADDFLKEAEQLYQSFFEDCLGAGAKTSQMNFYEVLETVAQFKEQICLSFERNQESGGNFINNNYCQGIILEEGCSADILNNTICANLKANIALGGQDSGFTKIKKNYIERGKKEGIFIVEGEENLLVQTNYINNNETGIVLLHSDGKIENNRIQDNETGISIVSDTIARVEKNEILDNGKYGVEIRDPAQPELKANKI